MQRLIRLVTLAPGHFHAALVQKEMHPGVHPRVYVYAPLDYDLLTHLARIQAYNNRPSQPTSWEMDLRLGANYLDRFVREPAGNTAVIAGRNRPKIQRILLAIQTGLHVLADKPWIINFADFPMLEQVFREADLRELIAWDMMTERFELTTILQREVMQDPEIFGTIAPGRPEDPALILESVHHLKKQVSGRPLLRPAWWFDEQEAGDGITDVGTHLADLAFWLLKPREPVDYRRELTILEARRWPIPLSREQFAAVTGLTEFPPSLLPFIHNNHLHYYGNGTVSFVVGGIHVRFTVLWNYEAEPGHGDSHDAVARGSRAKVAVRQQPASPAGRVSQPELFVAAVDPADHAAIYQTLKRRCQQWQTRYPGIDALDLGGQIQLTIPQNLRVGHEEHFAEVFREFRSYFCNPRLVPPWERPNLLAKYYLTTKAGLLARGGKISQDAPAAGG